MITASTDQWITSEMAIKKNHEHYRNLVVNYIQNNKDAFLKFLPKDESIESYTLKISSLGTWAGKLEMMALCACIQVHFHIFLLDKPSLIIGLMDNTLTTSFKLLNLA